VKFIGSKSTSTASAFELNNKLNTKKVKAKYIAVKSLLTILMVRA
jgi:hypothetical protein